MRLLRSVTASLSLSLGLSAVAHGQLAGPVDPAHPGSEIYKRDFTFQDIKCLNRDFAVYLPNPIAPGETVPVVVYGHGQALAREVYDLTFKHLARKGVAVVFPA